jgi:SPX domain protein involved in polyphosphate accumulation
MFVAQATQPNNIVINTPITTTTTTNSTVSLQQLIQQLVSLQENIKSKTPLDKESLNTLAKQALQNAELENMMNDFLLSGASVRWSEGETRTFTEQERTQLESLFHILFELYKSNLVPVQTLLVRHLPALLFLRYTKQASAIVQGALLCMYNVEALVRNNMKPEERRIKLYTRTHHMTNINSTTSVYVNEQVLSTLNSQKTLVLTMDALKSHNDQSGSADDLYVTRKDYEEGVTFPYIQEVKSEYESLIMRVLSQGM